MYDLNHRIRVVCMEDYPNGRKQHYSQKYLFYTVYYDVHNQYYISLVVANIVDNLFI